MKKEHWRKFIVGSIGVVLMVLPLMQREACLENKYREAAMTEYEIGIKWADVKWLLRMGKITSKEVSELLEATQNVVNREEIEIIMDEFLEGREEEYIAEQ